MRNTSYLALVLMLFSIGSTATDVSAQCLCEVTPKGYPAPRAIDASESYWTPLGTWTGAGAQRIAVVVWDFDRLYDRIEGPVLNYLTDVADAGFTARAFRFYGMSEDPHNPEAPDLRACLKSLWEEDQGLAGVVLVGNVQYVLWEVAADNAIISDALIGELDGELSDTQWQDGQYDAWTGDHMSEIWVSRIMARQALWDPGCGPFYPLDEAQILEAYFARNHRYRWDAFRQSPGATGMYASGSEGCYYDPFVTNALTDLFGDGLVTHACDYTLSEPFLESIVDRPPSHVHVMAEGSSDKCQKFVDGDPGICVRDYRVLRMGQFRNQPGDATGVEVGRGRSC